MFATSFEASRFSFRAALGLIGLVNLVNLAGLPACSKSPPSPSGAAASSSASITGSTGSTGAQTPAAAPSASLAPAAASAAPVNPNACTVVGSSVSIAKGARSDTGATPARLADGRLVIGYAVGNAPRAAVFDPAAGTASAVDVEGAALTKELASIEKGSTLVIHRVTPFAATELKMRVLVDAAVTAADKSKRVRCGFADADRIVGTAAAEGDAGASSSEQITNCRSFTDGKKVWFLSSWSKAASDSGKPESRWALHTVGEDGAATETSLGAKNVPDPKQERYAFDLPASVHEDEAGYLLAGRFNGNLALSRRAEGSETASELSLHWFNAASGMPALAIADRTVTILAPIAGKPDLYGANFPIEAKPPKPALLSVETEAGAGERTSLSLVRMAERPDSVLAFVEAKGDAKKAKLVVLDAALKPRFPALDLPGSGKATMVKLLGLDAGRVLAVTLDAGEIAATTIECPH